MTQPSRFHIRPIAGEDHAEWSALYADYARFYAVNQSVAMREQVWQWLHQPSPAIFALVAVDAQGRLIGFAHYRAFVRPLAASMGGYLDDLFVASAVRGQGVGTALIKAVVQIGQLQGWSVIRWVSAEDNQLAHACDDKLARHTGWQTYEISLK